MVGDDLTLTSNSKIDLTRRQPCFANLLPRICRVNHRLASYQQANELFTKPPNPYDHKRGRLKNQNKFLELMWLSRTHSSQRFGRHRTRRRAKIRTRSVYRIG